MTKLKVFGYARVSTPEQKLEVQIDKIKKYCDLKDYELVNIFEDKASGKNIERANFLRMIEVLRENTLGIGGVVIVKLDRLGRSVLDLVHIMQFFTTNKINICSIDDSIDTTSKESRLFFHFIAAFAEYERELILDRTATGRAFAKNMGVVFGRKTKAFPIKEINRDLALGIPKVVIAQKYAMATSTFHRKYKAYTNTRDGKIKKFVEEMDEEKAVI